MSGESGDGRPLGTPSTAEEPTGELSVRRARTADVRSIQWLVEAYAPDRILLAKDAVTLYEDVQEFWVAERGSGGPLLGCGAVHVMWEDLAEVRTLAVDPAHRGEGIGHLILSRLIGVARELGVARLFCLTFEVDFFAAHGFEKLEGAPVASNVYTELLRSYDEGVAEFLDLDRVKPNTLGNTRMMLRL